VTDTDVTIEGMRVSEALQRMVLAKLKDVAIENEQLRAKVENLTQAIESTWRPEVSALRAQIERLRAQAEIDNICIGILEKKNDELQTALGYWKPSQCGMIYPYPVAGEVVKYCKREHSHGGAHLIVTGETWV